MNSLRKNIIFVGKETGLVCLDFHLSTFPHDKNYIVVCKTDREKICSFLKERGNNFVLLEYFQLAQIKNQKFDWLLNLWGNYIFKPEILNLVEHSLNIHPSYLPIGRGMDPVVWAIQEETKAGATLHTINESVDEGDIWYQEEVPFTFPIRGIDLYTKVIECCIRIFREKWPLIRNMQYQKTPQDGPNISPTKRRADLLEDRFIQYNALESSQKALILKILAHDFGEAYSAILDLNDKKYSIHVKLSELPL